MLNMTAEEFKNTFDNRYVLSDYDRENHRILTRYVINGIYQYLLNQEKIIKKLNEYEKKDSLVNINIKNDD